MWASSNEIGLNEIITTYGIYKNLNIVNKKSKDFQWSNLDFSWRFLKTKTGEMKKSFKRPYYQHGFLVRTFNVY